MATFNEWNTVNKKGGATDRQTDGQTLNAQVVASMLVIIISVQLSANKFVYLVSFKYRTRLAWKCSRDV